MYCTVEAAKISINVQPKPTCLSSIHSNLILWFRVGLLTGGTVLEISRSGVLGVALHLGVSFGNSHLSGLTSLSMPAMLFPCTWDTASSH